MSDEVAIKVSNVSKNFKLPHQKVGSIKHLVTNPLRAKRTYEVQHALKNIDLEIKKGEFFGIVGRNGSGKSTLLKILAGIYQPTKGKVQVNGKLVPFIELGVGFNPELTGRENVYLNGALLGFSEKDITAMYDEIVEFAELQKFMDQKLKNYSSGMQVRLAFAVAIKADSDILVLDEVLAVGDEAFQRKCDDYFKSVKNDPAKTVILVTHNMEAVQRFCDRALYLREGVIKAVGSTEDISNKYTLENFVKTASHASVGDHDEGLSERVPYFKVTTPIKGVVSNRDDLIFDIEYEITDDTPVHVHFAIIDEIRSTNLLNNGAKAIRGKGKHKLRYIMPLNIYNNCNLQIHAVLDEEKSRERIAFTSDLNSCQVVVRNKHSNSGLINTKGGAQGQWDGWEAFTYDRRTEG